MTGLFGFKKIGQPDKASDAPLYAGYAIATLASGDASSARDLFRQSFHFGYASSESVELKNGLKVSAPLFTTVLRVHHDQTPPEARALWWEVFQEADADLFKELLTAIEAKQDDTGAQIYAEGVQYV
ncbi:hypothetical protein NBRC116590_22620 [Pelagimonas sp. KU-00592-HH]|uniref:hypothetical protein n=1 Tax=Pelagimonas sp. KU-00592-HH TaxID=3127651 RepID=UPI003107528F